MAVSSRVGSLVSHGLRGSAKSVARVSVIAVCGAIGLSAQVVNQGQGQGQAAERKVITGESLRIGNAGVETLRLRYEAGARTYWHYHEFSQLVFVEDGVARFQEKGGKIYEAKAGQLFYMKPRTLHWHGASAKEGARLLQVYPQGVYITLREPVTDAEYSGPATPLPVTTLD